MPRTRKNHPPSLKAKIAIEAIKARRRPPRAASAQGLGLTTLPPTVLYTSGSSTAVPIFFNADNPGFWNAGDQAGTLLLVGHGTNMDVNQFNQVSSFNEQFRQFALSEPGLTANEITFLAATLPTPEPAEWLLTFAGIGLLGLGWRRKSTPRDPARRG